MTHVDPLGLGQPCGPALIAWAPHSQLNFLLNQTTKQNCSAHLSYVPLLMTPQISDHDIPGLPFGMLVDTR